MSSKETQLNEQDLLDEEVREQLDMPNNGGGAELWQANVLCYLKTRDKTFPATKSEIRDGLADAGIDVSKKTVGNRLHELEEKDLVTVDKEPNTNLYLLNTPTTEPTNPLQTLETKLEYVPSNTLLKTSGVTGTIAVLFTGLAIFPRLIFGPHLLLTIPLLIGYLAFTFTTATGIVGILESLRPTGTHPTA